MVALDRQPLNPLSWDWRTLARRFWRRCHRYPLPRWGRAVFESSAAFILGGRGRSSDSEPPGAQTPGGSCSL